MNILDKFSARMSFIHFRKSASAAYWAMLAVLLILEVLVIKDSINIVAQSLAAQAPVVKNPGVRVNFSLYDKALARVQAAKNFVPGQPPLQNPFRTQNQSGK